MTAPPSAIILVVDDTPETLKILTRVLGRQGYAVETADDGSSALSQLELAEQLPDLIVLDINMPQVSGYDVCRYLKDQGRTRDIPVIFVSALEDPSAKVKGFAVGGADYITKPFQFEEVLVRVRYQLALRGLQMQLQEQNLQLQREIQERQRAEQEIRQLNADLEQRVRQRTAELVQTNQHLSQEIKEHKKTQQRLLQMALQDRLTGLPNRALFMQRLSQQLQACRRSGESGFAVLFLDCDRFKVVNDSLGHFVGDQLLVAISRRLKSALRPEDILARLGGDEFTVLLPGIQEVAEASRIAGHLLQQLRAPFSVDGYEVFINASIGLVLGTPVYEQPEHLLRDADAAMYQAKENGKGRYQVFNPAMHTRAATLLWLETDLRRAIAQQEFIAHYQPIIDLMTGRITGFEALLRWHHPQRGWIPPSQFIPVAEETGMIVTIGGWILRTACQQLRRWLEEDPSRQNLVMSVNLSPRQFWQPALVEQINRTLQEHGLRGSNLKLEITESAILDNSESVAKLLQHLRQHQIGISIDDFGTGYSSLSYLHRFPISTLKIDRSFVSMIDREQRNLTILQTITALAHNLSMDVVAEGIETEEQKQCLLKLGCEYGQGFYFSPPVDAETAGHLLVKDPEW